MFLRNFWYVAAYDHEIGRQPMGRMILGEPIVFSRMDDGTPAALEDRCVHRHLDRIHRDEQAAAALATE